MDETETYLQAVDQTWHGLPSDSVCLTPVTAYHASSM